MKNRVPRLLITAAVLIFHAPNVKAVEFMDVDKIQAGMTGYGLTVFHGTQIDTFNVEIIDVMKNQLPRGNIILARLSGGVIDTAGVVSGMSGSPVYVDGKLLGALAYSFGFFPTQALAGITPIKEMLNPPSGGYVPHSGKLNRMKIPISCPGLDDQMLQELRNQLSCFDLSRAQEGGGIRDDSVALLPGSVLGVLLVQGDLTWYAMGTCTYVQDNSVWGFGHPIAALGETELPMTGGYIYSVVPSTCYSYKMGAPTRVIGTIENDSERGIAGVMGKPADLIKLDVTVGDQKFHYQIIEEKAFLRFLFSPILFYSIYSGVKGTGDLTCEASLEIKANVIRPGQGESIGTQGSDTDTLPASSRPVIFRFDNLYTGTPRSISSSIGRAFAGIQSNPFQRIGINEISVRLTASDVVKKAKIDGIRVDRDQVGPGDTLNLLVSLSVLQGGRVNEPVQILIPPWVRGKKLSLEVDNGKAIRERGKTQLTTINAFRRWLGASPRDNEIVITLTQKGKSGRIGGEEFQALPPSVASFVEGKAQQKSVVFEKKVMTEWVIAGKKSMKLEVQ